MWLNCGAGCIMKEIIYLLTFGLRATPTTLICHFIYVVQTLHLSLLKHVSNSTQILYKLCTFFLAYGELSVGQILGLLELINIYHTM